MSRRRKKKKGLIPVIFLGLLIGVCIVVGVSYASGSLTKTVKHAVTKKVSETVMEQAVKQALESTGDTQAVEKAQEIVDNMDEGDKQKAEEIIERYADSDTLSDVMEIVGDGVNSESLSEVKQYLQDNVSEQDQAELKELYQKYSEMYGAEIPGIE